MYPVSQQLLVIFSAAYWFHISHPLLRGRKLKRSQGAVAEALGSVKVHSGALLQGLNCGIWSARILLIHITLLTASGEETTFVCFASCWFFTSCSTDNLGKLFFSLIALVQTTWWSTMACRRSLFFGSSV